MSSYQNRKSQSSEDFRKWGFLKPFFAAALSCRHFLYDRGLLSSQEHDIPLIGIGNLSVGGSGKTPMVEYLLNFLGSGSDLAVLSRGYGRKSKGCQIINTNSTLEEAGDELLQIKRKFPKVQVMACADRNEGVRQLLKNHPNLSCILLDDNFQHRAIAVDLQLLLSPFADPYFDDDLLPKGKLRDLKSRAPEADHLVITKCPPELSSSEAQNISKEVQPFESSKNLSFSCIKYGQPYQLFDATKTISLSNINTALLLTGIARTQELQADLQKEIAQLKMATFADHHAFTKAEIQECCGSFLKKNRDGIILCTQKDAVRLEAHKDFIQENKLSIYVLPAEVQFLQGETSLQEAVRSVLIKTKTS